MQDFLGDVAWTFEQEISRIPARNISVLKLTIATGGHVYGAIVLDLLRLCTSITKFKVELNRYEVFTRVLCLYIELELVALVICLMLQLIVT